MSQHPQALNQVSHGEGSGMPGPLGNAEERCRAKHQALGATKVLHLRNGGRGSGKFHLARDHKVRPHQTLHPLRRKIFRDGRRCTKCWTIPQDKEGKSGQEPKREISKYKEVGAMVRQQRRPGSYVPKLTDSHKEDSQSASRQILGGCAAQ